jgi:hypothetical protein
VTLPAGYQFPKYIEAFNNATGALVQNPSMTTQQAEDQFTQEATQLIGPDAVETLN